MWTVHLLLKVTAESQEGKKLTRPVDNDVSPARNSTLKGAAKIVGFQRENSI